MNQVHGRTVIRVNETSRREIGKVKRVGVLGPARACSDEEDVAGASEIVRAGGEQKDVHKD